MRTVLTFSLLAAAVLIAPTARGQDVTKQVADDRDAKMEALDPSLDAKVEAALSHAEAGDATVEELLTATDRKHGSLIPLIEKLETMKGAAEKRAAATLLQAHVQRVAGYIEDALKNYTAAVAMAGTHRRSVSTAAAAASV